MSSVNTSAPKRAAVTGSPGPMQAVWVVMTEWYVPNVLRASPFDRPILSTGLRCRGSHSRGTHEEKSGVGWSWVRCQETGALHSVLLGRSFHFPLGVSVSPTENEVGGMTPEFWLEWKLLCGDEGSGWLAS